MKAHVLIFGVVLATAQTTFAAEAPVTVSKDYDLDAEVSYLMNNTQSGSVSSDKTSLSSNVVFKRMQGNWGQEFKAQAITSQDSNSSDNLERYLVSAKGMYQLTPSVYEFAKLQAEKDLSSAFDYQALLTVGLGREFLSDSVQKLTAEAGLGMRYSKERVASDASSSELLGTLGAHYERTLSASTKFSQDLGYEYGKNSSVIRSKTAFNMAISEQISGMVSYQLKRTTADAGDSRDGLTLIGLKYHR
jgi:putative salt-induced outer membrane protein